VSRKEISEQYWGVVLYSLVVVQSVVWLVAPEVSGDLFAPELAGAKSKSRFLKSPLRPLRPLLKTATVSPRKFPEVSQGEFRKFTEAQIVGLPRLVQRQREQRHLSSSAIQSIQSFHRKRSSGFSALFLLPCPTTFGSLRRVTCPIANVRNSRVSRRNAFFEDTLL